MDEKILAMSCLCSDILKALGHANNPQDEMSDAEVMTTGLVAMLFLRGTFEAARILLGMPPYIPPMLSRRRLNRRLHRLKHLVSTLLDLLGYTWKQLNNEWVYIIDSFPITDCDNYRIPRAKLYLPQEYRGNIGSKKHYVYGLKLHLMGTKGGQPVECFLTPGPFSDLRALKTFQFAVPNGRHIYAAKAYNDYDVEDVLVEAADIRLSPMRKKHSTRAIPPYITYMQHYHRKTMLGRWAGYMDRPPYTP
jgi:Transposase DDE domain